MDNNGYVWLNELSQLFLERDYLLPGQTTDERVDIICNRAERILNRPGFAARFKDNLKKGWYSLASPIWTNFGTTRGLPISCFGTNIEDSMESILAAHQEVGTMTKYGGGTSGYFGKLRPRGSKINQNGESSGAVHFMQLFETVIQVVSQGSTRRGQFAGYLDIDHKDIEEFLTLRSDGSKIQNMSYGVCVPDYWMQAMIDGDDAKRQIWAKVIKCRANTGYPYIFFSDNANNENAADVYRDKKMRINHTNLCTEIMLPNNDEESFVCDLSSMNILHYDAWKNTDAVELLVYFLDAVMTEFIDKAKLLPNMERAVRFAERHRALGIGWVGYHSFLQSKMIPFESLFARSYNKEIAHAIYKQAYDASEKMALEYGEPELLKGYDRRHATLIAIAPTKSSAFILDQVSEGTQPDLSNFVIKDLQKGKFTLKNRYLKAVLAFLGKDTDVVWESILKNAGSVQHLAFLSNNEKAVFKTFSEITPLEIVTQAAHRQLYVDQGQSLNLMIHPSIAPRDVNALLISGWKQGIKSFYYQFSVSAAQKFSRDIMVCTACEG